MPPVSESKSWVRTILTNSGSLLGAVAVTSLLGLPYWWAAAHAFTPAAVGFAAAAVSAMTLLGTLAMLGLGTLLTGELARRPPGHRSLLATAVVTATAAGVVLGAAFALVGPRAFRLHGLERSPAAIALFAVGVGLTAAGMVTDQALIGLHRPGRQLVRNAVFSLTKLAAVVVIGLLASGGGGLTLYATWVGGLGLSLVWLGAVAVRGRASDWRPRWELVRRWRGTALRHHVLNLAIQAPVLSMPLVAAATVSVAASAYFYTAALIGGFFAYGAVSLTFALYAVGAGDEQRFAAMLRFTLRLAFGVILAANVVLQTVPGLILRVFGRQYAHEGAPVLRLVGIAVLLLVVKDHYVAIARVRRRVSRAAALCAGGAILEIGLAAVGGALGGLVWLAAAPLAALVLEVAVMSRTVLREAGWSGRLASGCSGGRHAHVRAAFGTESAGEPQ
jgi:O-antigen/teichoic acid export membrane protein